MFDVVVQLVKRTIATRRTGETAAAYERRLRAQRTGIKRELTRRKAAMRAATPVAASNALVEVRRLRNDLAAIETALGD